MILGFNTFGVGSQEFAVYKINPNLIRRCENNQLAVLKSCSLYMSVSSSCMNVINLPWHNTVITEVCDQVLANVVPFLGGTSAAVTFLPQNGKLA